MDSCWRVISDIQDDFALIRQLSFGKIKEMLCSVFTFSSLSCTLLSNQICTRMGILTQLIHLHDSVQTTRFNESVQNSY